MYSFLCILFIAWIPILDAAEINEPFDGEWKGEVVSVSVMKNLIARVEVLEQRDRNNQREMNAMKKELTEQKEEITQLQKKNADQDRVISKLLKSLRYRGATRTPAENATTSFRRAHSLNPKNRIRRANEEDVMFSTGLTKSLLHLGHNQNVLFDHVEVNKGNGYNPHHGVFTAPVAGTYVFHSSILAYNNREVWCNMVVNGQHKAAIYARATDNRHDQGSQVVIVQLRAGDDVSVQNLATDDAIYGDGDMYTTFSGFLLTQDFSQNSAVIG